MLNQAHLIGVGLASDDIERLLDRLDDLRSRIRFIAAALSDLLADVEGYLPGTNAVLTNAVRPAPGPALRGNARAGPAHPGHELGRIPRDQFHPGIHELAPGAVFLPKERAIAEWLLSQDPGAALHTRVADHETFKWTNPDCIIRRSPDSEGVLAEFKTLDAPTSHSVQRRLKKAASQLSRHGGGEAVVDGRQAGLTEAVARRGCARFLGAIRNIDGYVPARITIILANGSSYELEDGHRGAVKSTSQPTLLVTWSRLGSPKWLAFRMRYRKPGLFISTGRRWTLDSL